MLLLLLEERQQKRSITRHRGCRRRGNRRGLTRSFRWEFGTLDFLKLEVPLTTNPQLGSSIWYPYIYSRHCNKNLLEICEYKNRDDIFKSYVRCLLHEGLLHIIHYWDLNLCSYPGNFLWPTEYKQTYINHFKFVLNVHLET